MERVVGGGGNGGGGGLDSGALRKAGHTKLDGGEQNLGIL